MGHHVDDEGRFQSDRHPDLEPDKIVLSFRDPEARLALRVFAEQTSDRELARDIDARLTAILLEETDQS